VTLVEEACYTIRGWPQTSKEVKSASLHTVQKYCLLLFFPIVSTQFAHPVMHIFVLGMCLLEFWFHYNPRMCITWTQCVSLWAAPRCVWAPQDTCWSGKWAVREKTLQIMSSPLSSFFFFLGPNLLIFHSKWCHVCLGLICHLWVLDPPHLKAVVGPIYWLSANRIALLHWTLDLRLSSNVALSHFTNSCQYVFENQGQSD
jgi:hypothetical protein